MKAQNPYEGFFERSLVDAGPDRIAASPEQSLARELPSLAFLSVKGAEKEIRELRHDPRFAMLSAEQIRQMIVSEELANRDKFSFVSAALCGPLFLFGIGAAFALFDDIRAGREAKLQKMLTGKSADTVNGVRAVVKAETLEETRAKQEANIARVKPLTPEAAKLLGVENKATMSFKPGDSAISRRPRLEGSGRGEISERVKQRLFTGGERNWEEKAAERSLKSWLKTEILLKRKQSLLDHMERVRGREQFGAYAGLAAKMEVLDKALKRMGL
ncbi:MAG: hypothetical protein SFV17_16600 [Candidatus Obscuribacter sp.]|nr:hypothetical protein [Candidatus Obscuribacter sp.]